MENNTILFGVMIAVLIVVGLWWWKKSDKTKSVSGGGSEDAPGTIYGTMTCPYTVKQTEKYPDYKFVDCSGGKCPAFVSAFPTTKHMDGKIEVGFS